MVDAVSIGVLLINLLSITQSACKLTHSVRDSGPKLDAIYYRLIAEKERTEGWANHMRVMSGADLRSKIPPGKYAEVRVLLHKLDYYYERANRKYGKIQSPDIGGEKRRYAMLAAKVGFVAFGYDDLIELVDTIATMNKALKAIAPPLPSYTPASNLEAPAVNTVHTYPRDDMYQREEKGSFTTTNPPIPISPGPASDRSARLEVSGQAGPSVSEFSLIQPYKSSLEHIYRLCLGTLIEISAFRSRRQYSNPASRLKLWGAGVFGKPLPLDQLMKHDLTRSLFRLRQCLLETFAHILIVEERDLARLRMQPQQSEGRHVEQLQREITALLGTEEVVQMAVERWAGFLAQPGQDHSQEQGEEQNPEPTYDSSKADMRSIAMAIECLFDLLPLIREEQRVHFLHLEWAEKRKAQEVSPQQQSVSEGQDTEEDNMVKNLEEVNRILKVKDDIAAKQASSQGKRVKLYSPVFQKETERLAECYSSQVGEDMRSMSPTENEKFRQKQAQLAEILTKFVKQSQANKEPGTKYLAWPYRLDKKGKAIDVKAPLEGEEDDKRLNAFLNSLRDPITDLWNVAGPRPK